MVDRTIHLILFISYRNLVAKRKYEERVPICYRKPAENDPQSVQNLTISPLSLVFFFLKEY